MANIGYVRVSTLDQNETRQLAALQGYKDPIDKIFAEKVSGKNTNRPELQRMLEYVREGDVIIVSELSRLARSTRDLLHIIDELKVKDVQLVSLKESIDTTTSQGRFTMTVFGALSELEREGILERQREGIEAARREGKYKGRKPIPLDEKRFRAICARWRAGEITAAAAMKQADLKSNTFYRKVKERGL